MTQAGDYVLAIASIMLSRLRQDEVTLMLSQVSRMLENSGQQLFWINNGYAIKSRFNKNYVNEEGQYDMMSM